MGIFNDFWGTPGRPIPEDNPENMRREIIRCAYNLICYGIMAICVIFLLYLWIFQGINPFSD